MKTRTLLLLSVVMALAILMAGGVFLLQLANEQAAVDPTPIGESTDVGDVTVTVFSAGDDGSVHAVSIEIGGLDDIDGIESFRLVTGDQSLSPEAAPLAGRCTEITEAVQQCRVEFDVSAVESSSRFLVMRRGDQQRNWVLPDS
jgi:VCBS repeat-containing protein